MTVELISFRLVLGWAFAMQFHFEITKITWFAILSFLRLVVAVVAIPFSMRIVISFSDCKDFDWVGTHWRKPPRKPPDPFRFRNTLLRQVFHLVDC